jgi:hypothetical protein
MITYRHANTQMLLLLLLLLLLLRYQGRGIGVRKLLAQRMLLLFDSSRSGSFCRRSCFEHALSCLVSNVVRIAHRAPTGHQCDVFAHFLVWGVGRAASSTSRR